MEVHQKTNLERGHFLTWESFWLNIFWFREMSPEIFYQSIVGVGWLWQRGGLLLSGPLASRQCLSCIFCCSLRRILGVTWGDLVSDTWQQGGPFIHPGPGKVQPLSLWCKPISDQSTSCPRTQGLQITFVADLIFFGWSCNRMEARTPQLTFPYNKEQRDT